MKYLFVGGAPRSGTSALAELLSAHAHIAVGMERFKYLYNKNQVLPELFDESRFFSFSESETNVGNETGKYVGYYARLKAKYQSCSIGGDKYPQLYRKWGTLQEHFGGLARFVVIIRDVHDVASSFNVRALNENDAWPEQNDYRLAVELWNGSLQASLNALRAGMPLHVVRYEHLYDREFGQTGAQRQALLEFLVTEDCSVMERRHEEMCDEYAIAVKHKEKKILDGQAAHIEEHANFELLRELSELVSAENLPRLSLAG